MSHLISQHRLVMSSTSALKPNLTSTFYFSWFILTDGIHRPLININKAVRKLLGMRSSVYYLATDVDSIITVRIVSASVLHSMTSYSTTNFVNFLFVCLSDAYVPPQLFYNGKVDYFDLQRLGGLLSHLKKTLKGW